VSDALGSTRLPAQGHLPGLPAPDEIPFEGDGGPVVTIDNRTGLPDDEIFSAVRSHWVENAAMQLGQPSSFQLYATQGQGSMLARTPFRTPQNVIEEIKLARQMVDQDDDLKATIGYLANIAFGDGMRNQHPDEKTQALFNRIAREMNLDYVWQELYREWLIASQVNTVTVFTRKRLNFNPDGTEDNVSSQVTCPLTGVIPAEDIRVLGTDLFGNADLAYKPPEQHLESWLREFFAKETTAARRDEMRRDNPILAALFVEEVQVPWNDMDLFSSGQTLYRLNKRLVRRTTMAKGAVAYPRPLLTANFALLEAKRLLNVMDYALLQGGTNYIVVAKVGSDQKPGTQPEVDNLMDQVRSASKSGVLVGDHRVSIEIITPKLDELLSPSKRKLLGRKLSMLLLRLPEQVTGDGGTEGIKAEQAGIATNVMGDRRQLRRHIERHVWDETADRNPGTFTKGAPSIWFPRIVLAGVKDFQEAVTAARDRGDIPRRYAVEMLGYDYDSGLAERKRELARGDDDILTPASVPFSSPQNQDPNAPQDPNQPPQSPGRPPGGRGNGRPGSSGPPAAPPNSPHMAPPRRVPPALRGEEIAAEWDEDRGRTVRYGVVTGSILDEYPDHELGRLTEVERDGAESGEIFQRGPVAVVPVNISYSVDELRVVRLAEGLSMVVGPRVEDDAIVAKALCFREPIWATSEAIDRVRRWGFDVAEPQAEPVEDEHAAVMPGQALDPTKMAEAMAAAMGEVMKNLPMPNITIQMPEEGDVEFTRDPETGAISGKRKVRNAD
jgi:hypothetical protein